MPCTGLKSPIVAWEANELNLEKFCYIETKREVNVIVFQQISNSRSYASNVSTNVKISLRKYAMKNVYFGRRVFT